MVKINNRKLAKSAEKAVDKAGTAVKNVPNAQNLTRFIAQGLTYKIQRDLHNARDKIAQEAKDAGSQSEYQTAKILPLVRNISYLLNALSVEQFFQNNNDIPKACAGIQLATMFVGGQMLVSLEDVLASFTGKTQNGNGTLDKIGLKGLGEKKEDIEQILNQLSTRFNQQASTFSKVPFI